MEGATITAAELLRHLLLARSVEECYTFLFERCMLSTLFCAAKARCLHHQCLGKRLFPQAVWTSCRFVSWMHPLHPRMTILLRAHLLIRKLLSVWA